LIPKNHPRAKSLLVREKLVVGYDKGLVAKEGLIAHGRGEAFDYLLGEKTSKSAKKAIKAAAISLISAKNPVISVNGNLASLCTKEIIQLSKIIDAKIEVNLFYENNKRKKRIKEILKKNGAEEVFGFDSKSERKIPNLASARRIVDTEGIYSSDVVLVPLEDGDRTIALKKFGKKVIAIDLNPLSRTSQTADITIVDDVIRGMKILIRVCQKLRKTKIRGTNRFDNKKNLSDTIIEINKNLKRRARNA